LLVFLGGGLGSVLRYSLSLLCVRYWGTAFPYGTLLVNLTGCFIIGLCFTLSSETTLISPSTRLFIMTGMLGGLTTFSSYSLESMNLALQGDWFYAAANLLLNNVGGLLLALLGIWLGRQPWTG
jgi:CrcB protein